MRKERVLLLLGIWVAVLPYLGFPYSWKNIIFSVSGLGLIYLSFILNKEVKKEQNKETIAQKRENFSHISSEKSASMHEPNEYL